MMLLSHSHSEQVDRTAEAFTVRIFKQYQTYTMKRTRRTRKKPVKKGGINTNEEELISVRPTVIRWNRRGQTTVISENVQVYDLTDDLSEEENILEVPSPPSRTESIMNNKSISNFGTQEDENKLYPTNTCPVCFSALKAACIKGTTGLLQCTRCPSTQLLCGSCLYPTTSAACTNKLCPLVSTLLTCDLVSDSKSKVYGCPTFRACPKCHNLIMHEKGCKFVTCRSCLHRFCFICLQGDCSKDKEKYWNLFCKNPRAKRQRFMSPQS
ncbi:E3 ubiquitin-protein ligase dbl4 isoform X1 [Puntigrus tetrazona]|uniref:E3 ubiquitin-protein ligase dbl4 isoform X1 n=1 Tax=Puntigrus tetrazona TaxID=1606681 RepID=UPI001C893A78|nr:E3 ubiquitin-protein ligase dbl4 isoform X1 [Puntigrus tetrazona]